MFHKHSLLAHEFEDPMDMSGTQHHHHHPLSPVPQSLQKIVPLHAYSQKILSQGEVPLPRYAHAATLIVHRKKVPAKIKMQEKMLIFGGYTNNFENDMYEYDIFHNSWKCVAQTDPVRMPMPRANHSIIVRYSKHPHTLQDDEPIKLIVYGGMESFGARLDDIYEYDMISKTWSLLQVHYDISALQDHTFVDSHVHKRPKPRSAHTAVLRCVSPFDERMVVFGGWNGIHYYNDIMEFHFATNTWYRLKNINPPLARNTHAAVLRDRDHMVIFGGSVNNARFNDVQEYSFKTNEWQLLEPTTNIVPHVRGAARLIMLEHTDRMFVFGGKPTSFSTTKLDDAFIFDFVKRMWIPIEFTPLFSRPEPLSSYGMVHVISKGNTQQMLIFGGSRNDDTFSNDLYMITIESPEQSLMSIHLMTSVHCCLFTDLHIVPCQ